jgi:hypothetical protein
METFMESEITCPKCGAMMKLGYIPDTGQGNFKVVPSWVAGEPEPSFWAGLKTGNRPNLAICTFRCSGCGYLESYAKE